MNRSIDVIIVGGGVMGCAAAYQLAKDGHRVRLLERFTVGNHMGSSHGATRLFRLAHESRDYVELAGAALKLWHELEGEAQVQLMQPMDGLDLGSASILEPFRRALQAVGVPFEALELDEILRRFPQFNLPEGTLGLCQDSYAILRADRSVATFAELARKHGATIDEGQTVQQILPTGDSVQVVTDGASYSAGSVILCAGSWMQPLVRQLGVDLPLTILKEHLTYYMPSDPEPWLTVRFPIFRHHTGNTDGRWGVGFPMDEHKGVKIILDCTGPVVEPDDHDRTPDQAVVNKVRAYAASILPSLGNNIIEAETCRYTMTPDDDFILDRHPEYPHIVIASPCSGHGFKFAPLIGRILADLATSGRTEIDIGRFRLDRLGLKKK